MLYYAVLDDHVQSRAMKVGWSAVAYSEVITLTRDGASSSLVSMRGRQVQLQGSQGGFGFYSIGVRKEFNDKERQYRTRRRRISLHHLLKFESESSSANLQIKKV